MHRTPEFERMTGAEFIALAIGDVLGAVGTEFADIPGLSHAEHVLLGFAGGGLGAITLAGLTCCIRYGMYRRNQGMPERNNIASSVQELEELYKLD